ncbi:MAG: phenylalanine--tRNA ligase subunit beta [Gammaproteobacteria bacterium]|nr:phenylalanine--tRNA ligase subunit beta [Gammaproteobacteria bacterium]
MKFSEHWLREWVNPPLSTAELAGQLTLAGLEVESVTPAAPVSAGVVVGEVLSVVPHPQADKLHVCEVDIGTGTPLSIVCGAANVRAGMRVPAAMVGAELPGGKTIRQAQLRGVDSHGMLCSAAELGLAEASEGLLELPQDTRVGEDVYLYLRLDDTSIDVSVTPNRGDCLSVAGIAREVAALNQLSLHAPSIHEIKATVPDHLEVVIEAPADCPRYAGRVLRGINRAARTPLWLQERLRRSGMRSISAVVDVTNYVMLELGQPMHAFDLARLRGNIHVRRAVAGEAITLLDGQRITLNADTLVIADDVQPQAIAGIMGGIDAAISATSDSLFLESAYFAPQAIAGRARAYGLRTESSHRFERGVAPTLQRLAMERATALLLEIVGGEAGPVVDVSAAAHLPQRPPITLRAQRLQRVLGLSLPAQEVTGLLTRLGMQVTEESKEQSAGWQVTPPPHRFDVAIEADLIEEVARLHGYQRLPAHAPRVGLTMTPEPETRVSLARLRELLVDRGYQEVITYSFVEPGLQQLLDPATTSIALANPISAEMSVMRTTLWCGLLATLRYNQNRQQTRQRLFESGLKFTRQDDEIKQKRSIAGIITGSPCPEQWGLPQQGVDFYDIKGDVEALLGLGGLGDCHFEAAPHPALHPGQSARILRQGEVLGWVGALHPALSRTLGLDQAAYVFELSLDLLEQARVPAFREVSKFPAIRRDIAIVVEEGVPAAQVLACVTQAAEEFLRDLQLFDVYRGKGVDSGRKSIALGLTLQAPSRTLTDEDVAGIINRVVSTLKQQLGATLRD